MSSTPAPSSWGPVWARWVGRFLFRVWWPSVVVGRDRVPSDGPVVFAANHIHALDGPLLIGMAPRPLHILTKRELFHGPVGTVLRSAGQIEIDRENGRQALTQALAVLRRGGAVGIFPEGHRGTGTVMTARAGAAWLAVNGQAAVVPVAILGTRRPGESTGGVPSPGRRCYIEFGEPVAVARDGLPRRVAIEYAAESIRTAVASLVAQASSRTGLVLPVEQSTAE